MTKPRVAYIYKISNKKTGKVYVGSAFKDDGRFKEHKRNLNLQRQSNKHLQNSWNKHGPMAFVYKRLEVCSEADRFVREHWWMVHLKASNPKYGYNIVHPVRSLMPAERRSAISKEIWSRPGLKEQVALSSAERWNDPAYKAKMTAVSLAQWQDKGRQKRHKDRLAKYWANPKNREALRARNVKRWSDKKARASHAEKIRAKWQTADYQEKQEKAHSVVMQGYFRYLQRKARG
jgi:group I intron endonuclease